MGCRPSRNALSRVADSTCEYNRCYMKDFDHARRKQKKSARENRKRNMPTYNNFSSTSKVYDHTSGTSKITVRLSTDGSMLEIEQFDIDYRNEELPEVAENPDEDSGLVMKSVSELKALHKGRTPYGRCDSAPLLISSSSTHEQSERKETSCGFTGCCIQKLSSSRTVSDEYKIRSDSITDGHDDDVMIEHNCEVHRDSERGNRLGARDDFEHEPFNKSQINMDISNDEYETNFTENTNVTKVSVGTGTETINVKANVCQKTSITVKRSTLEQQVEEANKKIMEQSRYLACSTFKPANKNDKEICKNEAHGNCQRNQHVVCNKHSKCHNTSGEMIGHPDNLSSSLTIDIKNTESNSTEQCLTIDATDSINTNNKEVDSTCSICDCNKLHSDTGDASICYTHECTSASCRYQTCHECDKMSENNGNQCYQTKLCCSHTGMQKASSDVGVYYCCCYSNFKYNDVIDQRSLFIQKSFGADHRPNGKHFKDGQFCILPNDCTHEHDLMNIERQAITGDLTCSECGKIYLHPVMFADPSTDISRDDDTASHINGNESLTKCYYQIRDTCVSNNSEDCSKRHRDINEVLETNHYEEMTNRRPCVPNKTVTRGAGALHNLQYLQKSIPTKEEATKYITTEHFQINNCIRCDHSEYETLNAADNLKSVAIVTNEVPNARLTENRICSCMDMIYDKESIKIGEHEKYISDLNQMTKQIASNIPCTCRTHHTPVVSKDQRTVCYGGTVNGKQATKIDVNRIVDDENCCSDTFPYSEYESFVVRDNRCEDTEYESFVIRDNKRYDETDYQDSNENSTKPLLESNNEDSLTPDDSINSEDEDDVDFDDSSDACMDEYVDALETTYV